MENMLKNDVIKDVISKIEKEVAGIQCDIEELEKRRVSIHQRRILNGIRHGENDNIINVWLSHFWLLPKNEGA